MVWLLAYEIIVKIKADNKEVEQFKKKEDKPKNEDYEYYDPSNYVYNIDDGVIMHLLNLGGREYRDNWNYWFSITSILKTPNKKELWDEWSKPSKRYNTNKNEKMLLNNNYVLDINYLVYLLNKDRIKDRTRYMHH